MQRPPRGGVQGLPACGGARTLPEALPEAQEAVSGKNAYRQMTSWTPGILTIRLSAFAPVKRRNTPLVLLILDLFLVPV